MPYGEPFVMEHMLTKVAETFEDERDPP